MGFFAELQDNEREFDITDILTTLEEVFLNIAKKSELENAVTEGSLTTLTLPSGTSLQIPIGARFIGIPGTETTENPGGNMVEVHWQQVDSGTLCISGHCRNVYTSFCSNPAIFFGNQPKKCPWPERESTWNRAGP